MHSDLSPEQVMSAPSEELVLMLFEAAVAFAREARDAIRRGDDAEAAQQIGRATAIVRELDSRLDPSAGLVGQHLAAIYEYVLRRLAGPRIEIATLDEVIDDLTALAGAWTGTVASRQAPAPRS